MTVPVLFLSCILLCLPVIITPASVFGYDSPDNLVANSGFEDEEGLDSTWSVTDAKYEIVTDPVHMGKHSLRVYDRTDISGGPRQQITVIKNNTMYYASLYIQIPESSQTVMFFRIRLLVRYNMVGGGFTQEFIAMFPSVRGSSDFRQLGGEFITGEEAVESVELVLEVEDEEVEYFVDSISVVEIPEDPDWQAKADENIRKHRMENVTVNAQIPERVPYCKVEFKVSQTEYDFPWGSAVQTERIAEDNTFGNNYRNFIFKNFNWVVFGNTVKWKPMEPAKGNIRSERVLNALDIFDEQGIKVRGHSVLFGMVTQNPLWVQNYTGEVLRAEVLRRINYTLDIFNGRFVEWDLINEWFRAIPAYYETAIGDPDFHAKAINLSKVLDPAPKYVINEYGVLKLGQKTSAAVDLANTLRSQGADLDGIGVQSHLRDYVRPEILRNRMEVLSTSGLPIVITEMSVHQLDERDRRDQLDEALRLYYSYPAVSSITLWFWSNETQIDNDVDNLLFIGEDFEPTLAGQRYLDLREDWTTNKDIKAFGFSVSREFEAFHGGYNIETLYNSQSIRNESFYLSPTTDPVEWQVSLDDGDFPPDIPPEDYLECDLVPPAKGVKGHVSKDLGKGEIHRKHLQGGNRKYKAKQLRKMLLKGHRHHGQ